MNAARWLVAVALPLLAAAARPSPATRCVPGAIGKRPRASRKLPWRGRSSPSPRPKSCAALVPQLSGQRLPVAHRARGRSQPDDGHRRRRNSHRAVAVGLRPGRGRADLRIRTRRRSLRKPREFLQRTGRPRSHHGRRRRASPGISTTRPDAAWTPPPRAIASDATPPARSPAAACTSNRSCPASAANPATAEGNSTWRRCAPEIPRRRRWRNSPATPPKRCRSSAGAATARGRRSR